MTIKAGLTGGTDPVHRQPRPLSGVAKRNSDAPAYTSGKYDSDPDDPEKQGPGWTKQWGRSV